LRCERWPDGSGPGVANGGKIVREFLALWGQGVIAKCFDAIAEWKRFSDRVVGHAVPSGHYIRRKCRSCCSSVCCRF
jgi:hypothetical protein